MTHSASVQVDVDEVHLELINSITQLLHHLGAKYTETRKLVDSLSIFVAKKFENDTEFPTEITEILNFQTEMETEFNCPICNQKCSSSKQLQYHIMQHCSVRLQKLNMDELQSLAAPKSTEIISNSSSTAITPNAVVTKVDIDHADDTELPVPEPNRGVGIDGQGQLELGSEEITVPVPVPLEDDFLTSISESDPLEDEPQAETTIANDSELANQEDFQFACAACGLTLNRLQIIQETHCCQIESTDATVSAHSSTANDIDIELPTEFEPDLPSGIQTEVSAEPFNNLFQIGATSISRIQDPDLILDSPRIEDVVSDEESLSPCDPDYRPWSHSLSPTKRKIGRPPKSKYKYLKHKKLSSSLSKRVNNETAIKPFQCPKPNCNKSYKLHQSLTQHLGQVHSGTGIRYNCQFTNCTYSSVLKSYMTRHLKDHDRIGVPKSSSLPPFKCPKPNCGRSYKLHPSLIQHLSEVHSGFRYVCNFSNCTYSSVTKSNMKRHWKHHDRNGVPKFTKVFQKKGNSEDSVFGSGS